MTNSHPAPSSIRDDSICESSLPPNKSSGDIGERLRAAYEWIRRPDWEEEFSLEDIAAWMNKRPSGLLLESAAEIERLRREVGEANTTIAQLDQRCALFERSTITAESAVAAAWKEAAKIAENYDNGRIVFNADGNLRDCTHGRAIARRIQAAGSKKTAESGHSPSTHNSESE